MKQTALDEIYHFHCTCCGDCCTGDMEININIYDLYKMARYMNFKNTGELFTKQLISLVPVQNECLTPQIVFRTKPFKFCPWLINDMGDDSVLRGFCSLHPFHKPLICKMAPVGRVVDFANNSFSYMLTAPTEHCPGMDIKEENLLSFMRKELEQELDFEYRYYQILENIKNKSLTVETMLREFYSFPINIDFEEILSALEIKSKVFIE